MLTDVGNPLGNCETVLITVLSPIIVFLPTLIGDKSALKTAPYHT